MIELEWSETLKKWIVLDDGYPAGQYDTYEEASDRIDVLRNYYRAN